MTKCLFVTIVERHVLLIKNANLTDHFSRKRVREMLRQFDISQDDDALPPKIYLVSVPGNFDVCLKYRQRKKMHLYL
jgi:hypothetical protein